MDRSSAAWYSLQMGNPFPGLPCAYRQLNNTLTDDEGNFSLLVSNEGETATVSTWAEGYYCAKVEQVSAPASGFDHFHATAANRGQPGL